MAQITNPQMTPITQIGNASADGAEFTDWKMHPPMTQISQVEWFTGRSVSSADF